MEMKLQFFAEAQTQAWNRDTSSRITSMYPAGKIRRSMNCSVLV